MIQQAITRALANGIQDLVNQQNRHVLHLDRLRAPHPHADASIVLLRSLAAHPESREQVAVSVFLVPQGCASLGRVPHRRRQRPRTEPQHERLTLRCSGTDLRCSTEGALPPEVAAGS